MIIANKVTDQKVGFAREVYLVQRTECKGQAVKYLALKSRPRYAQSADVALFIIKPKTT